MTRRMHAVRVEVLVVIGFLLPCHIGLAQVEENYYELIQRAYTSYQEGRWEESVTLYERAFSAGNGHEGDFYNGACSAALAGNHQKARQFLSQAVHFGYSDFDWISKDKDLASLVADPIWDDFHADLLAIRREVAAGLNQELLSELEKIREKDQHDRQQVNAVLHEFGPESPEFQNLKERVQTADKENLASVEKIIEFHGWPGRSMVGSQGSQTAFLVIQHAPLEIQEQYLPLMRDATAAFELHAADLALLEDRILIKNGKPQIYGSQIKCDPTTFKDCFLQPIADEANVNTTRARVGLGPLENYVKRWAIEWSPPIQQPPSQ